MPLEVGKRKRRQRPLGGKSERLLRTHFEASLSKCAVSRKGRQRREERESHHARSQHRLQLATPPDSRAQRGLTARPRTRSPSKFQDLVPNLSPILQSNSHTSEGSLSAASTPLITRVGAFFCSFPDIEDRQAFAALT